MIFEHKLEQWALAVEASEARLHRFKIEKNYPELHRLRRRKAAAAADFKSQTSNNVISTFGAVHSYQFPMPREDIKSGVQTTQIPECEYQRGG
jgi:hypothetical protein